MKGFLGVCYLVCISISILALSQAAKDTSKTADSTQAGKTSIEGLVRDVACPIQNPEATATHLSMKCLRACVKAGSPLVVLTKEGELYLPISDKMPDEDQQQRLTPFLGKYVRVTGTVYERKGTHAIAISEIKELKNVHLNIEDQ